MSPFQFMACIVNIPVLQVVVIGASQINYFRCRKLDVTLASALSPVTIRSLYCTGMSSSNRSLKVWNVSLPIHHLYCKYTCHYGELQVFVIGASQIIFNARKDGHHPGPEIIIIIININCILYL